MTVPLPEAPVLLIPAHGPSRGLPDHVGELLSSGAFRAAVVVDDGSAPEYGAIFDQLRALRNVAVVEHLVNLGKGAALKTGLNYLACQFRSSIGAITADADGQHAAADILAAAAVFSTKPKCLVLGARRFEGPAPLSSRIGNAVTRSVMHAVTGQKLMDTETGLRGIPRDLIPSLLRAKPTGYDFELEMLVECKYSGRPIVEVPSATVYIERNRSSHFNPLWDSMRIYFIFLRFAATSLMTAAIDNLVFVILLTLLSSNLLACMAGARLVACSFNYIAGKRGVFHSKVETAVALPKFWLSAIVAGTLSYGLIHGLTAYGHVPVVPAKLGTESLMFFFSFVIQRDFVFSPGNRSEEEP